MNRPRLILLRRSLVFLFGLTTLWSVVVASFGGFILEVGPIRVSSRNPRNVVAVTVLLLVAIAVLSRQRFAGSFLPEGLWWKRHLRLVTEPLYRRFWWVVSPVGIAVVGVALDVYQWGGPPPLWLDEETIALNFRDRSFAELAGSLWFGQSAPLGWLFLQRLVVVTVGTSEVALRLVPLLFGIATIGLALWVGQRWMSRAGATILVLLCWAGSSVSHYRFETKHYTADVFWALLLPALAARALEGNAPPTRLRRSTVWWIVAALGQFFANGALLVTPGCALVLCARSWYRDGRRAAAIVAAMGVVWLASFSLNYQLSLRHAHTSPHLRGFWASALPPDGAGIMTTISWLSGRFRPLAGDPGGSELWVGLWSLALFGLAFGHSKPRGRHSADERIRRDAEPMFRHQLGVILATVPISAFALAAFGYVPLRERLALWIVPSLYVGVALASDRSLGAVRDALGRQRWLYALAAIAMTVVGIHLTADVVRRGWRSREAERPRHAKQRLNDHLAVRWLLQQYQTGDALVATRLTWPAIWWYSNSSVGAASRTGNGPIRRDGMYEVEYLRPGQCRPPGLKDMLKNEPRVLVYLGFRDHPEGFDDLLLRELDTLGTVIAVEQFDSLSRVAVVELGEPASPPAVMIPPGRTGGSKARLDGCVGIRRAERW